MYEKNQFKGTLTALVVGVMLIVATAPVGIASSPAEPEPEKKYKGDDGVARGVVPLAPAVYLVNGAIIGSGVSYSVYEYLDSSDFNDVNKTLRSAVHDNAISTAGVTDSLYTDSYNDLDTMEGQIAQVISQDIAKDQDYNTQSDYNISVENAVSEELEGQQRDFTETHNFNSLDVKTFNEKLAKANASDDIYVENADEKISVSNTTELKKALNGTSIDSNNLKVVINLQNDISIGYVSSSISNLLINMNGYTLNQTDKVMLEGIDQKITYVNGEYSPNSGGAEFSRYSNGADLVFNIFNAQIKGSDNNIALDEYQSSPQFRVYNGSDVDVSFSGAGGGVSVINNDEKNVDIRDYDVTLDPVDVDSANLNNKVEFVNENNKTANITGISYQMATSYAGSSNNTLDIAMPYYKNSNGNYTPIDYKNGESLYIQTPTSGVSDRVEPVPYPDAYNLIDTRDSRSDSVFTFATNYADNLYQSSQLSEVVQNETKTVSDVSNLSSELGVLSVDKLTDSDDILSLYAGVYPSFQNVANDRVNITYNGETYDDAVLFSNDMVALESTGNNNSSIDEGETLDGSQVSSAFLVDTNSGDKVDLNGTFTVDSVQDADDENATSLEITDYTRDSVSLDDRAVQLEKSSDVTIEVVDSAGGGSGGGLFDGVNSVLNDFADALGIDPAIVKVGVGVVVLVGAVRIFGGE